MADVTKIADIVKRRFGRDFDKPCENPDVLECSLWECQVRDKCARKWTLQWAAKPSNGGAQ